MASEETESEIRSVGGKKTFPIKLPAVKLDDLHLRFLSVNSEGIFSTSGSLYQVKQSRKYRLCEHYSKYKNKDTVKQ
jgi:hypothetical protein